MTTTDYSTPLRVVISTLIDCGAGIPNDAKLEKITEALGVDQEVLEEYDALAATARQRPDPEDRESDDELDPEALTGRMTPEEVERYQALSRAQGWIGGLDHEWLVARASRKPATDPSFSPEGVTARVLHALQTKGFASKATDRLQQAVMQHCLWMKAWLQPDRLRAKRDARSGRSITPKRKPKRH